MIGTRIQQYRIVEALGAGGMGEVYAARDERLQRLVALKALRPERRMRPEARERLLAEARVLSRLEHGSICRIHDYLEDGDDHYLVLELIRGRSLQEAIAAGDVPRARRVEWALQIADALVAAHGAGIVHHDLKPANVMIAEGGRVKVLDFGLAAHRIPPRGGPAAGPGGPGGADGADGANGATGGLRLEDLAEGDLEATATIAAPARRFAGGSPLYMSPEQARGEPTGTASDMFAFGLLLHELFTGTRAYALDDRAALYEAIAAGRAAEARTHDRDLTRLIARLKDPVPSRRPTALDAAHALRRVQARPARRLRRGLVAAAAVVALAAGVKYTIDVRREREVAEFRRSQAEGLIEFMLGDLRERLEPVGRLDALSAVGDEALGYFASLDDDERTPADRERYGRALSQIGAVKAAQGDLDGAMAAYAESVRVFESLVAETPADAGRSIALGGAHFGVGSVHWARDELDEAQAAFDRYLALAVAVHQRAPDNPTARLELGYALTNVAAVHEALGRVDAAVDELTRAIEIKRSIAGADPANREARESLANTVAWLASTVEPRGELRRALALRLEHLALLRQLADPRHAGSRRALSVGLAELGTLQAQLGRTAEARAAYAEDVELSGELHRLDPTNADWTRGLAIGLRNLATLPGGVADAERRAAMIERAAALLDELLRSDPDNPGWRIDRLSLRRGQALLAREAGDAAAARRYLAEHVAASAAAAAEPPGEELRRELVRGLVDAGRWSEALALAGEADDAEMLDRRFRALDGLGRREEARKLLERLAAIGYAPERFRVHYTRYGIDPPAHDGPSPDRS